MQTVGIDLSAEPAGTAVAVMEWSDTSATVVSLQLGTSDEDLLGHLRHPDGSIGIDCPIGWPAPFVRLISGHHAGSLVLPSERPKGWRREYVLRATDMFVHEHTGITPLSVAADRIGHTAIRLAALLAEVAPDVDVSRDGSGAVAEVYPAASLKIWELPFRGYKGGANLQQLGHLVDALKLTVPWLDLGEHEGLCRRSDDAFDAVVCALLAKAVKAGATIPAPNTELALTEGWIHLPSGPLPAQPWR